MVRLISLSATVANCRVSTAALAVLLMATASATAQPNLKTLGCFTMKEKPTISLTSETMNPTLCAQSCAQSQYVLIAPSPDNRLNFRCACTSQIPTTPSRIPCTDKCPGASTTAGITCGGFDESGSGSTIGWSLYPPSVSTEKSMKVAVAASPPATAVESRPPFEPIFEPNAKPQVQALMNTGNVSSAADASLLAPTAAAAAVARPEISSAEEAEKSTISEAVAVASATKSEPAKPSEALSSKEEEEELQQQQTRADIKKPAAVAVSNNAAAAAAASPESVVKQVEQFVAAPTFLASAAGSLVVLCGVFLIIYRRRRRKRQRHENGVPPLLPQTQEKKDKENDEPSSISRGSTSFKDTTSDATKFEAAEVDVIQNGSENVRFGSMRGLEGSNNSFTSETFGRKKAVDELSISVSQSVPTLGVLRNNFKDSDTTSMHSNVTENSVVHSQAVGSKSLSLSRSTSLAKRDTAAPPSSQRRRRSKKNRWNERVRNMDNHTFSSRFSLASNSTSATNSPLSPTTLYIRRKRSSAKSSSMSSRAPSSLFMNVLADNLVQNAKMEDEAKARRGVGSPWQQQ
ncbi:hypothetical protein BJ741DRAFT_600117 [Chytriomyces cf. hyalinus JEL632]|nr:hypothetical protein BJ741DRAFT_600117 [Chytriomyces cf. hyalinus JEL632]